MRNLSIIIALFSLLIPARMAAQAPVDTIQTSNPQVKIVLMEDNSWKMLSNGKAVSDKDAAGILDMLYPGRTHDIARDAERQSRKAAASASKVQAEQPAEKTQSEQAAPTDVKAEVKAENSAAEVDSTASKPAEPVYHKVKSGDTLYAISKKYGTTIKSICKLNGISEKTTLSIGRRLRVK